MLKSRAITYLKIKRTNRDNLGLYKAAPMEGEADFFMPN
jgi:hypothetical protein